MTSTTISDTKEFQANNFKGQLPIISSTKHAALSSASHIVQLE